MAVLFTFSFSTAFADTKTYTAADYSKAFTDEIAAQLGYLESAKNQVLNASYTYNGDGFTTTKVGGMYVFKASIEAAANAVIDDLTTAMNAAVRTEINNTSFPTTAEPNLGVVRNETSAYLTADDFEDAVKLKTDVLAKHKLH